MPEGVTTAEEGQKDDEYENDSSDEEVREVLSWVFRASSAGPPLSWL